MALTRERILSAGTNLPYRDVPADEIEAGETIRVRCLTAGEAQNYQLGFWRIIPPAKKGEPTRVHYQVDDACARLLVLACCEVNPDGSNGPSLFTSEDVAALLTLNGPLGLRLFKEANDVSGFDANTDKIAAGFSKAQSS